MDGWCKHTTHTHLPSFYSFENAAFFLLIRDGQFEIIFQFPLYECAFSHIAELVHLSFKHERKMNGCVIIIFVREKMHNISKNAGILSWYAGFLMILQP